MSQRGSGRDAAVVKIANPFPIGLIGGLGVLVALSIGSAVGSLATVLTYVLTAGFLALGLEPVIAGLQRLRLPRWAALLVIVVVALIVVAALVFAIVPLIVQQSAALVNTIAQYSDASAQQQLVKQLQSFFGSSVNVSQAVTDLVTYLQKNAASIGGGVLAAGLGVAQGVAGAIVVIILTLYFSASLPGFKQAGYRLVPMTQRARFAEIAEQIFASVGRYVVGQVSLALVNGVLSFIFLSIIGAKLPAVFALIAFLGSLIPLVGSVSAAVIIVIGQLALAPGNPPTWIAVAVYYVTYLQLEAYVLSPNIMNRAVKVPGVVVVIAALAGGTLLGILGALIAIPVAASVLLILEQVLIPRQAAR
jgi:predicted PurR-regulated permease PerM